MTALAFSGWDPQSVAAGGGDPGALWFITGAVGFGLGSFALWCLERVRIERRREPRPLEPARPTHACAECGRALWTANELEQHRAAKHRSS